MKQNQKDLGNKLVVVAGGAGEIGERITRMFLQQGARVLVPSRSREKLKALNTSLTDVSTGELIPLETDVSTPQGLKTLSAAIESEGILRAAVSSVGTFWQGPSSLEVPLDEVHRVFEETFFPYVGLTQALIPALGPDTHFIKLNGILSLQAVPNVSAFGVSATAQMAWTRFLIAEATESTPWITELVIDSLVRTRRFVGISSNMVGLAIPGMSQYITTKMGIIGFMRGLANDVANDGITANSVLPGLTNTLAISPQSDEQKRDTWSQQAIKRLGEPGDVTGAILFLTSDDAAFITGQAIVVDGGQYRIG